LITTLITVAIDTPGGNLSLKIKSRAQQITLNPNIIKEPLCQDNLHPPISFV
jgi:hypothetical protein